MFLWNVDAFLPNYTVPLPLVEYFSVFYLGHTLHKLSQRRLTADWLAPWEINCSRMHSKVSSDWMPSYIKATRPVHEIFNMAGYFPDSPRIPTRIHCMCLMNKGQEQTNLHLKICLIYHTLLPPQVERFVARRIRFHNNARVWLPIDSTMLKTSSIRRSTLP